MARLSDFASYVSGAVDKVVLSALRARLTDRDPQSEETSLHRQDRRASFTDALEFYGQPHIRSGEKFFVPPPFPHVRELKRRIVDNGPNRAVGSIVDFSFASTYEPSWAEVRDRYLSHVPNRTVHARHFRQARPRATLICLHGYAGGNFFLEEHAFDARLFHALGLDVLFVTLPFHGLRAQSERTMTPSWPSADPAHTNEGFGQAISDLRALLAWLKREQGDLPVVVMGMSLGGYTAALLATLEPLALVVPIIPVASFAELMWAHSKGDPDRARAEREGITLEMFQAAMAVHLPLGRKPLLSSDRAMVLSAAGDQIAPPEHATRLARHFGCQEIRFAGGHVLQLGRKKAFAALVDRMRALDLILR